MKKGKLIELVLREAVKNGTLNADDAKRVSFRQVESEFNQLYADAIALMIKDGESAQFFTKSYVADINKDSETKEYYCDLPVDIVQLPLNAGIHAVRTIGSNRLAYPINYSDADLIDDIEVGSYYDRLTYILDGQKKLVFKFWDFYSKNIRSVQLKLIVSFSVYGYDDEVSLPSGKATELTDIISKKLFQQKKQIDTTSDGNSL